MGDQDQGHGVIFKLQALPKHSTTMADLPDITRLRAALDVALTTLDSCSRPNSAAPSPAPAPSQPRRILEPGSPFNNTAQEFQNNAVTPEEGSSRDELIPEQQSVPVAAELVNAQLNPNLVERVARQETRIRELEEHILQ